MGRALGPYGRGPMCPDVCEEHRGETGILESLNIGRKELTSCPNQSFL